MQSVESMGQNNSPQWPGDRDRATPDKAMTRQLAFSSRSLTVVAVNPSWPIKPDEEHAAGSNERVNALGIGARGWGHPQRGAGRENPSFPTHAASFSCGDDPEQCLYARIHIGWIGCREFYLDKDCEEIIGRNDAYD